MVAVSRGGPGAFSTFANAAAPRPDPRLPSSSRLRRLRARPPLLSSPPPMVFRARGWRPPPPPLLLLLLWVTGQAAPVAGLGLGSDTELQIERRSVPDECPRTVRSGDFVRYHYVGTFPSGQKFDSRYRALSVRPASPLPCLRTGLSLPTDLPQLRPASPALLPLPPPTPKLRDPEPRSPGGEPAGPCAPLVLPPRAGRTWRRGVGTSHALLRPAHLQTRNLRKTAPRRWGPPPPPRIRVDVLLPPCLIVPSGRPLI